MGVIHNVGEIFWEKSFPIIAICLILIEVLNQFTFYLAKVKYEFAAKVKVSLFWVIFTGGVIVYIYMTTNLPKNVIWQWDKDLAYIFINLVLSYLALPTFSLSPEFRFFFLHGKFKRSENK